MSTDSGPAIELDQRMLDQFRLLERSGRPGMLADDRDVRAQFCRPDRRHCRSERRR